MTAHGPNRGFVDRWIDDPDGAKAAYVLFVPHHYRAEKPYPLLIFLHGAGETGRDGRRPTTVGLGPAVRRREKDFPFFVVFPQSQEYNWHADSDDARRALRILSQVQREYHIDRRRVGLTGISMGGSGVWSWAINFPNRWSALVPVCGGGGYRLQAGRIAHIPCWCVHGELDGVVSVEHSRAMVAALRAAGGQPRYDEYAGVDHHCWDLAYDNDELYDWLLRQRQK
ncbi:MAG: alpha/beta hydrolase-fold protein [Gemmataceae bacterium]|nr:alpha/beta hydrolase-fold protein [Gemmataceae bacterium]MDW8264563.1 alpha/beta hydrolase-fold protein [Gemmataceae bacterium]